LVTDILLLLIGLPLIAAVAGWLLAGREPEVIARQPPCSLLRSADGTFASCASSVYPAAASARVAGAPIFRGRPDSVVDMHWIVASAGG